MADPWSTVPAFSLPCQWPPRTVLLGLSGHGNFGTQRLALARVSLHILQLPGMDDITIPGSLTGDWKHCFFF